MLAILTFLASGPGGALLGFVINLLDRRREADQQKANQSHERDLAYYSQLNDHAKLLDKSSPGTLKPIRRHLRLWGLEWSKTTYKVFATNAPTVRAKAVVTCLIMLVTTYCFTIAVFAIDPVWTLHTLHPDNDGAKYSILWGLFKWTGGPKAVLLNTGGAAFFMAAGLNFLITTAIVGVGGKLVR